MRKRKSKTTYRCEACGGPAGEIGIRCRPCAAYELDTILACERWRAVRGTTPGDLPGETLEDTLRRERAALGGER